MKLNQNLYSRIIGVFCFLLLSPWLIWQTPGKQLFQVFFLFCILCLSVLILKNKKKSKSSISILSIYIALVFWTFIPFRDYDGIAPAVIFIFSAIMLFCLNNSDKVAVYKSFYNIYVCANCFFIFAWLLYLFKVPFPKIMLENTSKDIFGAYYYVYYGVVYINTQVHDVPFFSTIIRNHGFFKEPGHLGLYNCLFLLVYNKYLSRNNKVIIFLSTFLTFSAPSLIFSLVIFVSYYMRSIFHIIKAIIISLVLFFVFSDIVSFIVENFILNKLSKGDGSLSGILDARANDLYVLPALDFFHFIFGYGKNVFEVYDVIVSDYRNTIYKFGIVYLMLFIFPVLIVFKKSDDKFTVLMFISLTLVIFFHRAWMLESAQMFMFVFFMFCSLLVRRDEFE
ncbi:hypothetical protein PUN50_15575 [Vibrio campbellii]|uniref:Uncharacterized protein n=1 Tax=Vibrio campbellii TaxID=680 RepID=A0AAQ3B0L2_9VIBR|nr:hypothetical protein [Vibrio campbellii]WDG08120.1 hypothetical protein PUN50_15575 [Vibrio campbellii]